MASWRSTVHSKLLLEIYYVQNIVLFVSKSINPEKYSALLFSILDLFSMKCHASGQMVSGL